MRSGGRRHSLHVRLAGWMIVSTLVTVWLFFGALYLTLRIEEADERAAGRDLEEAVSAEASEQLLLASLFAGPIAVLIAAGGAMVLSRRALRPIGEIIAAAGRVTASSLTQRLPLPRRRDELHDLTAALNGLLERLDDGFSALARYAADASHELRTPLAVIISRLEVAARHPRTVAEWEEAVAAVLSELRRLAQLVEALLTLARADSPQCRQVPFDLREQVDVALASCQEQANARDIALSPAAEGGLEAAFVVGEPDTVASTVRNLIDNALRFTPRGGRVRVALAVRPGTIEVTVDDSGPGVAAHEREIIFLPLRRGTARAADGDDGYGLGLAIVRRVMQHHGGSVHVEAGPLGGARFILRFQGVQGGLPPDDNHRRRPATR